MQIESKSVNQCFLCNVRAGAIFAARIRKHSSKICLNDLNTLYEIQRIASNDVPNWMSSPNVHLYIMFFVSLVCPGRFFVVVCSLACSHSGIILLLLCLQEFFVSLILGAFYAFRNICNSVRCVVELLSDNNF